MVILPRLFFRKGYLWGTKALKAKADPCKCVMPNFNKSLPFILFFVQPIGNNLTENIKWYIDQGRDTLKCEKIRPLLPNSLQITIRWLVLYTWRKELISDCKENFLKCFLKQKNKYHSKNYSFHSLVNSAIFRVSRTFCLLTHHKRYTMSIWVNEKVF